MTFTRHVRVGTYTRNEKKSKNRFRQMFINTRRHILNGDLKLIRQNPLTFKFKDYLIVEEEPGGSFYVTRKNGSPASSISFSSPESAILWISSIEKNVNSAQFKGIKLYIDNKFTKKVKSLAEVNDFLKSIGIKETFTLSDWKFAIKMKRGDRVYLDIDDRDIYLEK
ncbi:MAG: hypothetical protein ACTSYD_02445 [Candidatus Heimdallarchaeaceae archaeon]